MAYKFEKYSSGGGIIDVTALPSGTPVVGTWTISEFDAIEDPTTITQDVENIYFNTALSTDEVVEILSKLTFTPTGDGDIVVCAYGANLTAQSEVGLGFVRVGTEYMIMSYFDGFILFATAGLAASIGSPAGWNPDFNGTYVVNGILVKPGETTPIEFPVDNQQAKYSRLMSLTPDFGAGKENVVYRVTEKVDADVYYRYDAEDSAGYCNMQQLAAEINVVCNPIYYVVDALPENPEVSNISTLNPVHCYIVNDIAYVYGNAGSGNVWLTAAELLAPMDIQTTNNGFTADITKETTTGIFVTYKTNITLHYYKDGEWHGGGGGSGGIVDVEELPVEYKDVDVYARFDASEYYTLLQVLQKSLSEMGVSVVPDLHYYVVDELPTKGKVSDVTSLTSVHCYIANNIPYVYGDFGGGNMWIEVSTVMADAFGMPMSDKGFTLDITTTTEAGIYVTYKKGEMPDESVIYRTKSDGVQVWFKNGSDKMSIEVWLTAMGATHNTIYHIVDSLPSNPEISGGSSNDILTFHVYVLNSTGVPYSSNNGETYSVFSLVEPVRGWVDSTDEMAEDGTYVLRVKGGGGTAYGIPTANAEVYALNDGEWVAMSSTAGADALKEQIDALTGQVETLETENATTETQIETLTKNNESLTNQVSVLSTEVDEKTASANFTEYAVLTNDADGVVTITDVTDTNITAMKMHDMVSRIGDSAFSNCFKLESITIPDGVTSIGASAFSHCQNLKSITIPGSVTSIGTSAFNNCYGLTSIMIPSSVTTIEKNTGYGIQSNPFYLCNGLTHITVEEGNPKYHSDGDCLIETESGTLIAACKNSVIPSDGSVTRIGDHAFGACFGLTTIVIPDTITRIGDYAFDAKYWHFHLPSRLESIIIPDSVTSIGNGAFNTCINLKSITIPGSVTSIGMRMCYGCSALTSVTIQDGVTSIGESAFDDCSSLKSITIPGSVTSMGMWAFYNCSSLESVTISEGVTSIGGNVFEGCTSLTSIILPDTLTTIYSSPFKGCSALSSIHIPKGVENITYGALGEGVSFDTITVSEDNPFYHVTDGCLIRTEDKELVRAIANDAIVPTDGSVTTIGGYAFAYCKFSSITLPGTLTTIGGYAFASCTNLTSIVVPAGVTEIKIKAFSFCTKLANITIPNSVTSIGYSVFDAIPEDFTITYTGTKAQWRSIVKDDNWITTIFVGVYKTDYTVICTDGTITVVDNVESET